MTHKCYRCSTPIRPEFPWCDCRDGQCIVWGDCREVLPVLGKVDLVLTDPPYGIGDKMQGGTWGAKKKYADFREWDIAPTEQDLTSVRYAGDSAIIWGGNYFSLPPSRCWLVWDKQNAVRTMSDVELAWTTFDRPSKRLSLPVGKHRFGHSSEKPMSLILWSLSFCSPQTVLDPYCGSGTTGEACKLRGIRSISCEVREEYCEIAAERLRAQCLPWPEEPKADETEQLELFEDHKEG